MSSYCIYEKTSPGTLYEPPDEWCDVNEDHDCENCPYYFSEDELLDYEYEFLRESFDF